MPRIMIVDDDPEIIDLTREILGDEGYTVIGAESGEECLKKLKEEPVDLVLMDFFMPGMDGRTVIEKIRETPDLKDAKIAFFTSATFRKRGMEIMKELNIVDYITKSFDMDDFISRIKKITGK